MWTPLCDGWLFGNMFLAWFRFIPTPYPKNVEFLPAKKSNNTDDGPQ
jgi:hypothetical protein